MSAMPSANVASRASVDSIESSPPAVRRKFNSAAHLQDVRAFPLAPTRRELLLASGTLFAWAYVPKRALAEGRDPRLLVIVLRGALDGLAAVAPVGDPDWIRLRGEKALTLQGATPGLPLDSMFALNPAMPNFHRMYKAGEATIVHAFATRIFPSAVTTSASSKPAAHVP